MKPLFLAMSVCLAVAPLACHKNQYPAQCQVIIHAFSIGYETTDDAPRDEAARAAQQTKIDGALAKWDQTKVQVELSDVRAEGDKIESTLRDRKGMLANGASGARLSADQKKAYETNGRQFHQEIAETMGFCSKNGG